MSGLRAFIDEIPEAPVARFDMKVLRRQCADGVLGVQMPGEGR